MAKGADAGTGARAKGRIGGTFTRNGHGGTGTGIAKRQKIGTGRTKPTPHPLEKKRLSVRGSARQTAI